MARDMDYVLWIAVYPGVLWLWVVSIEYKVNPAKAIAELKKAVVTEL